MHGARALSIVAILVAAGLPAPAASPGPVEELVRAAPGLSFETAGHLLADDAGAFRSYGRETGNEELRLALAALVRGLRVETRAEFERTSNALQPLIERVARVLAEEYGCTSYLREALRMRERSRAAQYDIRLALRALAECDARPHTEPREALRTYDAIERRFESLGYERGILLLERSRSGAQTKLAAGDARLRSLRHALELANRLGEVIQFCQALGELGALFEAGGQRDSTVACYEFALEVAERHRVPEQTARLTLFLANLHAREGRLALATEMTMNAIELCRLHRGAAMEPRFVFGAMERFARLEAWDAVEALLLRTPVLLRRLESHRQVPLRDMFALDEARYRARLLFARGEVREADRLMRANFARVQRDRVRVGSAEWLHEWAEGLFECGHARRARPIAEQGLRYCDSLNVPEIARPIAWVQAEIAFALGDSAAARTALQRVEQPNRGLLPPLDDLDISAAALRARLAARSGDTALARTQLNSVWNRIHRYARSLDANASGYIALQKCRGVREAAHSLMSEAPRLGYDFELRWRSLPRELGQRSGTAEAPESLFARAIRTPLPPEGTVHSVFAFDSDVLLRWTATARGVRLDTLRASSRELLRRTRIVLDALDSEPVGGDAVLKAELRSLAKLLLPAEVLDARELREFAVSSDGPLAALPFEALDSDGSAPYEALASRVSVVAHHSPGARSAVPKRGPPSVLADPAIPEKLRRRHPELASLAETRLEAERVLARWPGAVCLSGAEARRDAVLESWSRAPRIYVASHTVHVPEIPFITFIPLAAAGPAPLSDGYLEVGDIRSIDLTGCERVVLSACSSGRRWVGERPMSPSLGDAFLDSGAGLVASTLRPIEDLRAREAMEPVLDEWSRSDADPVAGFLRAIRRTIERRGESGNPRAWATWNLTRSGWPRAADGAIARHSGASAAARF